jgi:hypothetical protein
MEASVSAFCYTEAQPVADEFPTVAIRLETDALGRYSELLFQPFKAGTPDGLNSHVLFLPLGLKFSDNHRPRKFSFNISRYCHQ